MSFTVNIQPDITLYIYYILIHLYIYIVTTSRRLGVLINIVTKYHNVLST